MAKQLKEYQFKLGDVVVCSYRYRHYDNNLYHQNMIGVVLEDSGDGGYLVYVPKDKKTIDEWGDPCIQPLLP